MKLKIRVCLYVALAFISQGCTDSCPVAECGFPDNSLVELAALGGTLTTRNEEIVNINSVVIPNDGQFVSARLSFYFSPEEGRETIHEIEEGELFFEISDEYELLFSQLTDNIFLPIAPTFVEWDPPNQEINGYSSAIRFENSKPELFVDGNHLLHTNLGRFFVAPINASHIELWRNGSNNEQLLIRRIELASLAYWQEYIVPLITNN